MKARTTTFLTVIIAALVFAAGTAEAEYGRTSPTSIDPSLLRIDEAEYLGAPVKTDYLLVDGLNREFTLSTMLGKPLVLLLSYFDCDGACPTVNRDLKDMLSNMEKRTPGEDFSVLTLSFDKKDDPSSVRMFEEMVMDGGGGGGGGGGSWIDRKEGWKVAVMKDSADIETLAGSVGFKFFWSPRDRVFVHPSVFIVLSPEGRVVRYLYSSQTEAKDLEVAVAEAAFGTPGRSKTKDLSDLLMIACYSYNYKEGKYTLNYPLFIGAGSLVIGLSFIVFSLTLYRKKARR